MKGEPTEIHGDGIMTEKHGAVTEWMKANSECLESVEEGDTVFVIDEGHASTSTQKKYEVVDVPNMGYDFNTAVIQIVEVGTLGPRVTIAPGKVSKTAQR